MTSTKELKAMALDDAQETFGEEQLAFWNDQATPPEPKRNWLRRWLGRFPEDCEWDTYANEYRRCLKRAMSKLDKLWDHYVENVEADWDLDQEVTCECLDEMDDE